MLKLPKLPVYRRSAEFTVIAFFFKFVSVIKLQANHMCTGKFAVTETGWCRGSREDPEANLNLNLSLQRNVNSRHLGCKQTYYLQISEHFLAPNKGHCAYNWETSLGLNGDYLVT